MPDGAVRYVHVVGRAVRDQADELEFIGSVMDVTAAKRAEESLHKAQADLAHATRLTTLGELAASIAHEINQPLAAIMTNGGASLRWLDRTPPDLDAARQAVSRSVQDAHRAGEVIRSLRALAVKSGPQFTPLDINGMDAMADVTDRSKILTITAHPAQPDGVRVAVEDTGTGFDPAVENQIFAPFYTTKPSGMGMGLSICRTIIEAHGGQLWARPNLPQGAIFHFQLPAAGRETSPKNAPASR